MLGGRSVLIQFNRFRGKLNIQRPKQPHRELLKFLTFAKPYYISPYKDKKLSETCNIGFTYKKDEDNPFQRIIAKELLGFFERSRLTVFYHQNPITQRDKFKAFSMFYKQNMHYKNYGKKTMQLAVTGTKYEAILDFYCSRNITVFSEKPDIKTVLKITKKFPQLVLLGEHL